MPRLCRQYRFKFYLNMNHFIMNGNKPGAVHPHTWELTASVISDRNEMMPFSSIEKEIDSAMDRYQDKLLNECPPFDELVPTVENAARYFFRLIQDRIMQAGWILLMLELSETPTRAYIVNGIFDEESIWDEWYEETTERSTSRLREWSDDV